MPKFQEQRGGPQGAREGQDYEITLPNGKSVTLDAELIQECLDIARKVSPNPHLKVVIGKPGSHSFKILNTDVLVLDPLMLLKSQSTAHFVTGHEASHDAISRSMTQIGLSEKQSKELGAKTGYQYIHNIVEDPVVNDFMCVRVPELRKDTQKFYDEQFANENAAMGTPDSAAFAAALGYTPRFVQYGSEIMRDWHTGEFSSKLDPDVAKVLPMVIDKSRETMRTFPQDGGLDEKQVLDFARRRFLLVHEYVWPDVERLVKMDLETERRRQQANQGSKCCDGRSDCNGQGGPSDQGNPSNQPGGNSQSQSDANGQQMPSPGISEQTRKEIEKLQGEASQQQGDQVSNQSRKLKEELEKSKQRQEEIKRKLEEEVSGKPADKEQTEQKQGAKQEDKEQADAADKREEKKEQQEGRGVDKQEEEKRKEKEESTAGDPAAERDEENEEETQEHVADDTEREPESELDRLQREKDYEEAVRKEFKKMLDQNFEDKERAEELEELLDEDAEKLQEELAKALKEDQSERQDARFDPNQLSPRAQRELDRAFEQMTDDQKQELEERAKEALKKIEEQVNRRINPSENQQDQQNQQNQQNPNQPPQPTHAMHAPPNFSQINKAVSELEVQRQANLSEWDREFERVSDKVEEMYHRILREILKDKYPDWDKFHPVGQELDVFTAMQAESDPRLLTKMFKNRIPPTEKDWAAEIIVDTSPSMSLAARPTFQAIVFMTELFHRLKFDAEISEFAEMPILLKDWDQKIVEEEVRKCLSKLLAASGGTTYDGTATSEAYERLSKVDATHKLLVVFSDAESMEPAVLCRTLKRIRDEGTTIVVHYGVGPYTSDRIGYYPFSFGDLAIGGEKPTLIEERKDVSEQRKIGEMIAQLYALDPAEQQKASTPQGQDFYETFFESLVDIMLHPEEYLKEAKKHTPGRRIWNQLGGEI